MIRQRLKEHLISAVIVCSLLLLIGIRLAEPQPVPVKNATLDKLDFLRTDDPLDRALLRETLQQFYPRQSQKADSLLDALNEYHRQTMLPPARGKSYLSFSKFIELLGMLLKFTLIYAVVLALTTWGVQTLAVWRFVREQQDRPPNWWRIYAAVRKLVRNTGERKKVRAWFAPLKLTAISLGGALFTLMLFSPAYVIAYSIKTRFDTNSILFMILLGVVSNGLLATYAYKFYTFLQTESRKGYVQTAIVKNLSTDYRHSMPLSRIIKLRKSFPGHVFQHIFINARYQYFATLKEQAAFLITGLVIIEMALNIQGHLCYELLQNLLYKNYDLVFTILAGIFLLVKSTEAGVDWLIYREELKYDSA